MPKNVAERKDDWLVPWTLAHWDTIQLLYHLKGRGSIVWVWAGRRWEAVKADLGLDNSKRLSLSYDAPVPSAWPVPVAPGHISLFQGSLLGPELRATSLGLVPESMSTIVVLKLG